MQENMPAISPRDGDSIGPALSPSGERRQKARFEMRCSIFLRTPHISDHWILGQTANVSAVGASFASKVALPPDESVEYVLTFPPELTHAPAPWRVRFFGSVVRVEPDSAVQGTYRVAVHTTKHRYLSREESAGFCSLDELRASASVRR